MNCVTFCKALCGKGLNGCKGCCLLGLAADAELTMAVWGNAAAWHYGACDASLEPIKSNIGAGTHH